SVPWVVELARRVAEIPAPTFEEAERAAFVFFFQAEDGIRDATVTGVQTCALPISSTAARSVASSRKWSLSAAAAFSSASCTRWCLIPRSGARTSTFSPFFSDNHWLMRSASGRGTASSTCYGGLTSLL